MRSQNSKQTIRAIYSFDSDATEGAPGVIPMGIYLPRNAIIKSFTIDTEITGLTRPTGSRAFAQVSYGLQTMDGSNLVSNDVLLNRTAVDAFIEGQSFSGNDFDAVPFKVVASSQVIMTINVGAHVAGGRWYCSVEYLSN